MCDFLIQKPITNFSFPLSLVDWFPEADVLKKRETLRQLVQSLQLRLNPDLQYDLQQGALPPASVMPQTSVGDVSVGTASDAAVLMTVATASDADGIDVLQTSSGQCDANEHKLSDESGDHLSDPVVHCVPELDETGVTVQLVTTDSAITGDDAVDTSLPATDETLPSSREAPVFTCTAATMLAQDANDGHIVSEQNDNKLIADAGHLADATDASDKAQHASGSANSPCQVADTSSCVVDSVSHSTVQCVNESLVVSAELQKNVRKLSGDDSADS